jgi:hypothetical protein
MATAIKSQLAKIKKGQAGLVSGYRYAIEVSGRRWRRRPLRRFSSVERDNGFGESSSFNVAR